MSAWMDHVKRVWVAGKKRKGKYSYKQAMIDAKKTYKKCGKTEKTCVALRRRVKKKSTMKILKV